MTTPSPSGSVNPAVYIVSPDVGREGGFTDIAVTLALRALLRKGLIEERDASDDRGNDYTGVDVTEAGLQWLESNQQQLLLRQDAKAVPPPPQISQPDDDLPF